mmetsp:Transcript_27603/g.50255  ORF Transcript_27603/g.50255 Transcript_27603/m.50255 type:complete len:563 (-) Transcript_27603:146-1834(-)
MAPMKSFAGKFAKAAFTLSAPSRSWNTGISYTHTSKKGLLPTTTTATSAVSSPLLHKTPTAGTILSTAGIDATSSFSLEQMCKLFQATPKDNLYLSATADADGTGGERGVCLYKPIKQGDVVLSIPIASCFRDDEPPMWLGLGYNHAAQENDITDYERYNPSMWASRLAASILDMELNFNNGSNAHNNNNNNNIDADLIKGREIWHSMLPQKDKLRASLPVHWGEEVLATSKCTALELAVDSAYFARASAVMDLALELKGALKPEEGSGSETTASECSNNNGMTEEERLLRQKSDLDALNIALDMGMLQKKCHDALDIVQTRACRVERKCEDGVQWGPPLRILAPIFDFINHGSSRDGAAEGSANARFGIENDRMCDTRDARLVVRAARDIDEGEEVLIDYGDSARPAWRCLTSYGFVPDYDVSSEAYEDEDEDGRNVENVAELWMNGLRFEVDPHSVPFDLVEVAAAQAMFDDSVDEGDDAEDGEGGAFTPSIARAIAKRATAAAFNLITEPEMVDSEEDWDSPELVTAASLAALLRWSQHKVLLAFAENLNLFSSSEQAE